MGIIKFSRIVQQSWSWSEKAVYPRTRNNYQKISVIAEALQNSQDGAAKKTAKRAMRILRGIGADLPPSAAMVNICNQLRELIAKIF